MNPACITFVFMPCREKYVFKYFFFFNGGWGPWRCKCLGPTKVLIWSWLAQGHTAGKGQKNVRQALVSLTSRLIRCIWRAETVPSFLSWYLIPGDSSVNVELNYIVTPNCFIQWTMNSKLLQIFFFFFFLAMLGLCRCALAFCSCRKLELFSLQCTGFSLRWHPLWGTGSRVHGLQ